MPDLELAKRSRATRDQRLGEHQARFVVQPTRNDLGYVSKVWSQTFRETLGQKPVCVIETAVLARLVEQLFVQNRLDLLSVLRSAPVGLVCTHRRFKSNHRAV